MTYAFGPFQLCTDPPLLLNSGDVVPATPRALACLLLLVERRSTAVGKQELMDALWPDSFVEEGSLTQLISLLRKVLAPGFPSGSPIQTIPKTGYRFSAEVAVLPDALALALPVVLDPLTALPGEPATLPRPGESTAIAPDRQPAIVQPQAAPASTRKRGFYLLVLAAVAVVLVAVFAGRLHRRNTVNAGGGRFVVAVLPFQNLSRAPDAAWVSVAVQEMLATDLRLSRSFRVLPAEDVNRALKEVGWPGEADPGADTLRRLGPDLDCDHAVLGAYLLQGGRIRLDLRVVNLRTGNTEQESTYEQP